MSDLVRLYRPDGDRKVVLDRHAARNESLSRRAKGLLYELCSCPADGWTLRHSWLEKLATDGSYKLQSAVTELRDNGYLEIYQQKGDSGQFGEAVWMVTDNPTRKPLPDPDNQDAVAWMMENSGEPTDTIPNTDNPYAADRDPADRDPGQRGLGETEGRETDVSESETTSRGDSRSRGTGKTSPCVECGLPTVNRLCQPCWTE